jgi:hypothetical protein
MAGIRFLNRRRRARRAPNQFKTRSSCGTRARQKGGNFRSPRSGSRYPHAPKILQKKCLDRTRFWAGNIPLPEPVSKASPAWFWQIF